MIAGQLARNTTAGIRRFLERIKAGVITDNPDTDARHDEWLQGGQRGAELRLGNGSKLVAAFGQVAAEVNGIRLNGSDTQGTMFLYQLALGLLPNSAPRGPLRGPFFLIGKKLLLFTTPPTDSGLFRLGFTVQRDCIYEAFYCNGDNRFSLSFV